MGRKRKFELEGECPQCGAIYGMYEMDWENCSSCGYSGGTVEEDEDTDEEVEDE